MTIEEMHYDFKKKFNKIDSQQSRNYLVPEIDWVLNEAQEIFKNQSYLTFEKNQTSRDNLRTLVVSPKTDPSAFITIENNLVSLPSNYNHFISGRVIMSKTGCKDTKGILYVQQHDDETEESFFNKSSFIWKSVNGVFIGDKIRVYDDGTFINKTLELTYLRNPTYMHNAESFRTGTYTTPAGKILTGKVNCDLPLETHRKIVDLAVLIAAKELGLPGYEDKIKLNN